MSDIFEQAKGISPEAEQATPQATENTAQPQVAVEYNGKVWDKEAIVTKFENADSYINQLKTEMEELRAKANSGATLDEVLSRMDNKAEPTKPLEPTKPQVAEVDVEAVAMNAYQKIKQQEQMETNLSVNIGKFKEQYGDKAVDILRERAGELDMSLDEAKELASTKPKAFERIFLSGTTQQGVKTTSGNINTQTLQQSNQKPVKLSSLKGEEYKQEFARRAKKYQGLG